MPTKANSHTLSQSYSQLAAIFGALEKANLEIDNDFGANIAGSFCWFLSPRAVAYLNKRYIADWFAIQGNDRFNISFEKWQGIEGKGANIKLNI